MGNVNFPKRDFLISGNKSIGRSERKDQNRGTHKESCSRIIVARFNGGDFVFLDDC